jgi:O-antigen/teichoic acid export membrane protein
MAKGVGTGRPSGQADPPRRLDRPRAFVDAAPMPPAPDTHKARAIALPTAGAMSTAAPFALATGAAAVASIAGVVLLTRLLGAQGYGLYATFLALVVILQNGVFLCLQTSIIRFHARAGGDRPQLATAVRLAFLAGCGLLALVWPLGLLWLGKAGVTANLAAAGFALLALRGWLSLVQAWNRAEGRRWRYLALEMLQAYGALALALLALQAFPGDPAAPLWAAAAAAGFAALCAPSLVVEPVRLAGSGPLMRALIGYGLPLALVYFAGGALALSDRLLVARFDGAAAAGAYAVAFALTDRAFGMALMPLPVAVKPGLFAAFEAGDADTVRRLLERSARWLIVIGLPMAAAFAILREPLARFAGGAGLAAPAAAVLPLLAAGALLSWLLQLHFALAFQLQRRTLGMLFCLGTAAAANIAANLVLIPRYGMIAAGWTTIAGYGLALALAAGTGRRHYRVPFPARYAVPTALLCALAVAAAQWLSPLSR